GRPLATVADFHRRRRCPAHRLHPGRPCDEPCQRWSCHCCGGVDRAGLGGALPPPCWWTDGRSHRRGGGAWGNRGPHCPADLLSATLKSPQLVPLSGYGDLAPRKKT